VKRVLLLALFLAIAPGCRRHPAVNVRALYSGRNSATAKLREDERQFSFTDPRLRSGKPFSITGQVTKNDELEISDRWTTHSIDLFVVKSAADLPDIPDLRKSLGDGFSVCGEAKAYIPDYANEERREGAARFIQYLSAHCR